MFKFLLRYLWRLLLIWLHTAALLVFASLLLAFLVPNAAELGWPGTVMGLGVGLVSYLHHRPTLLAMREELIVVIQQARGG